MNQPPAANLAAQQRKGRQIVAGAVVFTVVLVAALLFWVSRDDTAEFTSDQSDLYSSSQSYSGAPIPAFSPTAEQRLSQALAEEEQAYGICFGWTLEDGSTGRVQSGSSRGPDTRATECSKWVEVRAAVGYTSESSSAYDAADISVAASPGLQQVAGAITRQDFAELGVSADALIDDPVSAVGHAALALPLLLVQQGALEPAESPRPGSGTSDPSRALPEADAMGFPFWPIVLLVILFGGAVASVAFGVRATRRSRQPGR